MKSISLTSTRLVFGCILFSAGFYALENSHAEVDAVPPSISQNPDLGIVESVRRDSAKQRLDLLQDALAANTLWPAPGQKAWGDIRWALSLLYLNQRVDEANQRIIELAQTKEPFAYFGSMDYIRVLSMFGKDSFIYPGRLSPEAEAAMKEVLWKWVTEFQRHYFDTLNGYKPIEENYPLIDTKKPEWLIYASENHDLIRKTSAYLYFSAIKDDPAYRDRDVGNGFSVEENYNFYNELFKHYLRERATKGLWMELGAGYAKYSYATVFNLHDLSPDPEVRQLAKMFLDVSLIEEAQISYSDGHRTAGASRFPRSPGGGPNASIPFMKLFYGVAGGLSTHNREFETSSYKVPAIAVFLRQNADHIPPFVIQNRMIGESAGPDMGQGMHEGVGHGYTFPISPEPAIVNYCYKTPEYAMGGAVQDPKGNDSGITRQDRWSGILFNDATRTKIVPIAETQNSQSNSTRVHNAYWNVQHKNLMISKKMRDAKYMGRLMVYITPSLERVERDGWVFSSNGSAYAAVMAIGGQNWDAAKQNWTDTQFLVSKAPNAPFVFLAGGKSDGFESFDQFQDYVLKRVSLTETDDGLVIARPGEPEVVYFYNGQPALIGGKPIDLKPSMTYDSPYLRSKWGSGIVEAHWGPLKSVYDFNQETVQDNFEIPKEPESQPDDLPGAKHASQAAKKE